MEDGFQAGVRLAADDYQPEDPQLEEKMQADVFKRDEALALFQQYHSFVWI